ncbi:MAG: type II toxin-antitoxin system RelE/ParE family toxin [Pseudomonadota bacterium]
MDYSLSAAAEIDIEEIYLYGLIQFGEAQADHYAAMLEDKIAILCANPKLGRIDARVNPAIRRFECERHVIFYDVLEDHILIVRILHSAADYVAHLAG